MYPTWLCGGGCGRGRSGCGCCGCRRRSGCRGWCSGCGRENRQDWNLEIGI